VQKEPLTEYGYQKLTSEFKDLKEVQRPQIVEEIDVARSYGDLKENAEYHAAKEKQAFIEARIAELGDMISRAQVIDPSTLAHERVSFGSTVVLENMDTEEEVSYTIVGAIESNPDIGLISYSSPLAKQLMGKEEEDEVSAKLPGGVTDFEILKVYYKEICFEN
jgi:transcription elongation factor GreA